MNLLDAVFARYEAVSDSLRIVADIQEQNIDVTVQGRLFHGTKFFGELVDDVKSQLRDSRTDLDDWAVVSLVANFERLLFENLKRRKSKGGAGGLKDVHAALRKFKSTVNDRLFEDAEKLCKFRDWVAHGKRYTLDVPLAVPATTYSRLSEFLSQAGIYK